MRDSGIHGIGIGIRPRPFLQSSGWYQMSEEKRQASPVNPGAPLPIEHMYKELVPSEVFVRKAGTQ